MSIDEILIALILSKSRSPYTYKRRAHYEEIFQVPGPRGKLGIFLCPRNMKKYEENMKKYEKI